MCDQVDYILNKYQFFFTNEEELQERRNQALQKYITKYNAKTETPKPPEDFLDVEEQNLYLLDWQHKMVHFCKHFQPQLPHDVLATGSQIFKRFYINNTVMEYHPRIIAYTCLYLACKLEKLYVPIIPFLGNIPRQYISELDINACEILLIDKLSCNLCFFSHYPSIENHLDFLRQIPRYSNVDCYTYAFGKFHNAMIFSDVWLLHNPSEIAIAVIIDGAAEFGVNLETEVLGLMCSGNADFDRVVASTRRIRAMVHHFFDCRRDYAEINRIEAKLEATHTTDNLPYSIQSDKRAAMALKTVNHEKFMLPICAASEDNKVLPSMHKEEKCDFKAFLLPMIEKKDYEIESERFIATENQEIDFNNLLMIKENENDDVLLTSQKAIEMPAAAPNWLYPLPDQVQLPDSMIWVRMTKEEERLFYNYNGEQLPERSKNNVSMDQNKVAVPMLKAYEDRDLEEEVKENLYDLKSMLAPMPTPKKKENSISSLDLEDIQKQNQDLLETKMLMEVTEAEEFDLLDLNKLLTYTPDDKEETINYEAKELMPAPPALPAPPPEPETIDNDDIFDFKQFLMTLPTHDQHESKQ